MRGTASWALVVGLMVGFTGGTAILHEHVAPLVAEPAPGRATAPEAPRTSRCNAGAAHGTNAMGYDEARDLQCLPS